MKNKEIQRAVKRRTFIASMVGASAVLAGCAKSGNAGGSSGGGGGGELSLYTHNEVDEMKTLVNAAEKETGIKLNYLRLSSDEGWSRIKNEAPNFQADVQWGQLQSNALRGAREGYFESYESPTWDKVPEQFKDPKGRWYGWSYWLNLITTNKEVMKKKGLDAPESWKDLTDPQYKGEIVLPDPGTSGTAYLFVSTILQIMGHDKGWKYFEQLDKNVGQYTKSGTAPAQLVGEGEYGLGITWDQAVFDRIDDGYPMDAVFPSEGVGYSLDVVWMFKGTKHRKKAEKLIDFIGSKHGMEAAAKVRSMVTNPDVKGSAPVKNLEDHLIDYDAEWAAKHQDAIMKKWRHTFGSKK